MTENNAYSQVPGLQWKKASDYSICWKFLADKTQATNLPVGTYSMVFTATYTITDDFSTNLSTAYDENYSIEVIDCSNVSLVNLAAPTTWITDFVSTGTTLVLTSTIFLDLGINPSFQVISFTMDNICSNDKASSDCCPNSITYSLKTILSNGNENTFGFASIDASRKITTDLTKRSPLAGETISQTLKLQLTATTAGGVTLVKEQSFTVINCNDPKTQSNIQYLVNRTTPITFNIAYQLSFSSICIETKFKLNDAVINQSWINASTSSPQSSLPSLTVNPTSIVLDESLMGDYALKLFTYITSIPLVTNQSTFILSLCKFNDPATGGVVDGQDLNFDSSQGTKTLNLEKATITGGTSCNESLLTYSLISSPSWMTLDATNSKLIMNLTTSVATAIYTFSYKVVYSDGLTPEVSKENSITVNIFNCKQLSLPTNWVWATAIPGAFTQPFVQDAIQAIKYSFGSILPTQAQCGPYTLALSAMIDSAETANLFLAPKNDLNEVTANVMTRVSTTSSFTMVITYLVTSPAGGSLTKSFTINFFDCKVASGTVNSLTTQQTEQDVVLALTTAGTSNVDARCSSFNMQIYYFEDEWKSVVGISNPLWITQYSATAGFSTAIISFSVQFNSTNLGTKRVKFRLTNKQNTFLDSAEFKIAACKAIISQPFIEPSTLVIGGTANFARTSTLQYIQASILYSDPTNAECKYDGVTFTNLDSVVMTDISTSKAQPKIKLDTSKTVVDSYTIPYTHVVTLKVWNGSQEVIFSDSPRFFTVLIIDCSNDMYYSNPSAPWTTPGPNYTIFRYEENTGSKTMQINIPLRRFETVCGSLTYSITNSDAIANPNITVNATTGVITIATPAAVFWAQQTTTIRISNLWALIEDTRTVIEVYDCNNSVITPALAPTSSLDMVTTGANWSYQWSIFGWSDPLCPVDRYSVACTEGLANENTGFCSGFQINLDASVSSIKQVGGGSFGPRTILAQYNNEIGYIKSDHEGEFSFVITGWFHTTTEHTSSMAQFTVKATTPCDSPLSNVTAAKQEFQGDCRQKTSGGITKNICDDIHYTVFTYQSNPIVAFISSFPYSCSPTYSLRTGSPPIATGVPNFVTLVNTGGTYSIDISTSQNSDRNYDKLSLILYATIGNSSASTSFKLFVFNDCSSTKVPLINTGQTLSIEGGFIVSQHLLGSQKSISFAQARVQNPQDVQFCLITNNDLSLIQKFKPIALTAPFNSELFKFQPDQANNANKIVLHASSNSQVQLYKNGQTVCNLLDVNTNDCTIYFEIHATALLGNNGTYPVIATGEVNFKTECLLLANYYNTQSKTTQDAYWTWVQADYDSFQKTYDVGYQIATNFLAKLTPSLPSLETAQSYNITQLCGTISYNVANLDTSVFSLFPNTLQGQPPKITCYTVDPDKADTTLANGYRKYWYLNLQATFDLFKTLATFSFAQPGDTVREKQMSASIQAQCLGLDWSKSSIKIDDKRNTTEKNANITLLNDGTIDVVQLVLSDRLTFYYSYLHYKSYFYKSSTICGEINYKVSRSYKFGVINLGPNDLFQTELDESKLLYQQNGLAFNVYAESNDMKGFYQVNITAFVVNIPFAEKYPAKVETIFVQVDHCYVKSYQNYNLDFQPVFYSLNKRPDSFFYYQFTQQPQCNYSQAFNLTVQQVFLNNTSVFQEGEVPENSPMKINQISQTLEVFSDKSVFANKTFNYYLTGYLLHPLKYQKQLKFDFGPFKLMIQQSTINIDNSPPTMPGLKKQYFVPTNEKSTLNFGQPVDFEGNYVYMVDQSTSLSGQDWVRYKNNSGQITFELNVPQSFEGVSFQIYFTLADLNNDSKSASFITNVIIGSDKEETSFTGIKTTTEIKQVQFLYEEPPSIQPQKISTSGQFSFVVDKPIEIQNLPFLANFTDSRKTRLLQKLNSNAADYFNFELVPNDLQFYEDNRKGYQFEWNITNANTTQIDFQFTFVDYTVVSQMGRDQMRFKVLKPEEFVSITSKKFTNFESALMVLPKQVKDIQFQAQINTLMKTTSNIFKTISSMSALNIFMSTGLQQLWGMINSLQLIMLSTLFNLKMPQNAQQISVMILKMVSFDIIDTETYLNKMFHFNDTDTPSYNDRFDECGLEGSNFIISLGMVWFIEVGYILVFMSIPVLRYLFKGETFEIGKKIRRFDQFAFFYRFFLEGTLELCLSCGITLLMMKPSYWTSFKMFISSLFCIINLGMLIVMPIITLYISLNYQKKYWTDKRYKRKYRFMFEKIEAKKLACCLYYVFFIMRRYIMVVSLIALPNNFLFQILLTVHASLIFLIYLLHSTPFIDSSQDRMEIFNESTVLASTFFLFMFTDLVPDQESQDLIGWVFCGLLGFNLFVNVSGMVTTSMKALILKIKIFLERRKLTKLKARIEQRKKKEEEMNVEEAELNERKELAKINAVINGKLVKGQSAESTEIIQEQRAIENNISHKATKKGKKGKGKGKKGKGKKGKGNQGKQGLNQTKSISKSASKPTEKSKEQSRISKSAPKRIERSEEQRRKEIENEENEILGFNYRPQYDELAIRTAEERRRQGLASLMPQNNQDHIDDSQLVIPQSNELRHNPSQNYIESEDREEYESEDESQYDESESYYSSEESDRRIEYKQPARAQTHEHTNIEQPSMIIEEEFIDTTAKKPILHKDRRQSSTKANAAQHKSQKADQGLDDFLADLRKDMKYQFDDSSFFENAKQEERKGYQLKLDSEPFPDTLGRNQATFANSSKKLNPSNSSAAVKSQISPYNVIKEQQSNQIRVTPRHERVTSTTNF